MDNYSHRMNLARHHEDWVLTKLQGLYGTRIKHASPFGQALLSEETRYFMRKSTDMTGAKNLLRWLPDIIAVNANDNLFLVEAKAGTRRVDTGKHDIEEESLTCALKFQQNFNIDVVFIFSDGRGDTAKALADHPCRQRMCANIGRGSGTPFSLWPRDSLRQLIDPTPPLLVAVNQ